ncbi:hypothetical protein HMN09_00987200 [Mycena chlorophos]|uniref:Uncharacterized protein n=1 Tax=Mycena chlorophos TaxID=658473 RepID=A0A8H6W2Z4_MYCCL|nr:hypothetical protein HMN09_00987200 [Mycena chlorophos]
MPRFIGLSPSPATNKLDTPAGNLGQQPGLHKPARPDQSSLRPVRERETKSRPAPYHLKDGPSRGGSRSRSQSPAPYNPPTPPVADSDDDEDVTIRMELTNTPDQLFAEQRAAEAQRMAEEQAALQAALHAQAEEWRLAEQQRLEEKRRAEQRETERLAEQHRLAEEQRAAELKRLAEERRLAEMAAELVQRQRKPADEYIPPSAAEFAAMKPRNRHLNPHLGIHPTLPDPPKVGDAVPFQRSNGNFRNIVVPMTRALEGIDKAQLEEAEKNKTETLILTFALGGQQFFSSTIPIVKEAHAANTQLAMSREKYAPPRTVFAKVPDATQREAVAKQKYFAVSDTVGFIAQPLDRPTKTWTLSIHRPVEWTDDDHEKQLEGIRGAVYEAILANTEARKVIDAITQGTTLSLDQRIVRFLATLDAEWWDDPTGPNIATYLQPEFDSAEGYEKLARIIRKLELRNTRHRWAPVLEDGNAAECPTCWGDNHQAYLCPLTHAGSPYVWWGPKKKLNEYTEGPLAMFYSKNVAEDIAAAETVEDIAAADIEAVVIEVASEGTSPTLAP